MSTGLGPASVGIGWRAPHARELLQRRPPLGFIEVHSENFFAPGGEARAALRAAAQQQLLSLHGVGLGLGSACGLDLWHLDCLAELVTELQPRHVSDHAAFSHGPGTDGGWAHAGDLLPIGLNRTSLALMARHVDQVQQRLGRVLAVENISACLWRDDDEMDEPEFFNALTRSTGCRVLLDLNNLVVNALNRGAADPVAQACAWVDAIDVASIDEIHLAGHDASGPLVVDDHGSAVSEPVWTVYRHALHRLGPVPTLIEWDTALPDFDTLLQEADRAAACRPQRWSPPWTSLPEAA
ncbi:DUF692 domain-containing protein [Ideonella sp. B508-1]|uniref:DUF692 domain-containing protein n=1 Tax=Ideonella sp. B508-1 TaxID=137716 RepID=UPI0003B3C2E4|nr:DUF692 domain-containing protein [Ideonella sp. B508-1]